MTFEPRDRTERVRDEPPARIEPEAEPTPDRHSVDSGALASQPARTTTNALGGFIVPVFAAVAAVGMLPLFSTHLRHLSALPHRAHYALLLAGFVAVVLRRWLTATQRRNNAFRVLDCGLLLAAVGVFATAVAITSPWLVTVSLILVAGVLLRQLPSVDNVGYGGPLALLLLLLPFPLGFDRTLIQNLQSFATGSSSRLLDLLNVKHLVSGNILELPGQQLFIDEACSGIQSLFAMMTCVAVFAAWTRRPAILTIPLLISSVVMCTIVNILRIVIVVHAELADIALATGWRHEALGAGMFVLALGLVYCSEGFFLFFLAPVINPATGTPDNRVARHWNKLTYCLHGAVYGLPESEPFGERRRSSRSFLSRGLPEPVARGAVLFATLCFALVGVAQHVRAAESGTDPLAALTDAEEVMLQRSEQLDRSALPESPGDWALESFDRTERSGGHLTDSVTWQYKSPFYTVTVSLDYPFFGAHNVTECYQLTGWTVKDRHTEEAGYSTAKLHRPFGETAYLYYDAFDSSGTVELETMGGKLSQRLGELSARADRPTWQFQMIVRSEYGLAGSDLREIESAFMELRDTIRGRLFTAHGDGPAGSVK